MPKKSEKSLKDKKEVCKTVDDFFKESSQYRDGLEGGDLGWKEAEAFYNSKHWPNNTKRPFKNWIFQTVETALPILTDARPGTDIVPVQEEDKEDAEILDHGLQHTYRINDLEIKIAQASRTALKIGTGWLYVDWDPDKSNGEGEVVIRNLPWKFVYIDPTASEIQEAGFVGVKIPMRVSEARRKFPKFADQIKAQKLSGDDLGSLKEEGGFWEKKWSPSGRGEQGKDRFDLNDMAIMEEAYFKDYSMEEIPEEDILLEIQQETEDFGNGKNPEVNKWEHHEAHLEAHSETEEEIRQTMRMIVFDAVPGFYSPAEVTEEDIERAMGDAEIGPVLQEHDLTLQMIADHKAMHEILMEDNPDGKRPKYPKNIRLVVKTQDLILYDGPPPVDDGLFPLVPFYCYKDEDSVYGIGEVKNLIPIQKSYNEMDWRELQGLRLNANPGWVKDENSGVSDDELTNEDGLVITKNQGTEVSRLQPGQVSPQFQARKQSDEQAINRTAGQGEAIQGQDPKNFTAFGAIKAMQEASISRIRLKARNNEYSLKRLAWLCTSRIAKYWTSERKLRVYDKNGRIKFVSFDPERVQNLRYDIMMSPGTTAGVGKDKIFALTSEMLQKGALPPKLFFEINDTIPHRNKIIEHLEETDEMQAQLEALMQENAALKAQMGLDPEAPAEPGGENVLPMP